jgi:hypothetical protein
MSVGGLYFVLAPFIPAPRQVGGNHAPTSAVDLPQVLYSRRRRVSGKM